ncbi:WG repeat-containing protein [Taibaiella koreensis]|uniref:WG repeat-containing protein n=1 Tax=Taibaiella koreensis TaxID=1268548 RepID=UPI000E599E7D|nr:WG repeat-containing protein [Taibaiella koreensis]
MRPAFNLLFLTAMLFFSGCHETRRAPEALYYFPNRDTTMVGVVNGKGDTIIPAVHPYFRYDPSRTIAMQKAGRVFYRTDTALIPYGEPYSFEMPILSDLLLFPGLSAPVATSQEPAGEVYNREGRFCYYTPGYIRYEEEGYRFFAPDADFQEGFARYIENGKTGFVDISGNKRLPARWDFAEMFHYGYAKVYGGGWRRELAVGNISYIPLSDTAYSWYITLNGTRVIPHTKANSPNDYYIGNGLYLPHAFAYTPHEQHLVDSLNRLRGLRYTSLSDVYRTANAGDTLQFEITDRPRPGFPYYFMQGYNVFQVSFNPGHYASGNVQVFLVHKDTGEVYYFQDASFMMQRKKIPLAQWMVASLGQTLEWLKGNHPDSGLLKQVATAKSFWETQARQQETTLP